MHHPSFTAYTYLAFSGNQYMFIEFHLTANMSFPHHITSLHSLQFSVENAWLCITSKTSPTLTIPLPTKK